MVSNISKGSDEIPELDEIFKEIDQKLKEGEESFKKYVDKVVSEAKENAKKK